MIMTSETTPQLTPNGSILPHTLGPIPQQPSLLSSSSFVGLHGQHTPSAAQSYSFKLMNLPPDLSQREALLIFALVNDDVINVDICDSTITAYFKNLNTCITTAKLLDGKQIFGLSTPPVHVDYDASFSVSPAASAFNNLRLSSSSTTSTTNPGISPPSAQLHLLSNPPSSAAPPAHSTLHPSASAAPPSTGSSVPGPTSALSTSFDALQKRKSVGNQRSRFLFSDPFSANAPAAAAGAPPTAPPTANAPGSIDLSDLTGKSILMMESHNDAREYENLVRDPWGTHQMSFTSAPHTPGLPINNPLDWSLHQQPQSQPQPQPQPQPQQPQPQQKPLSISAALTSAAANANGPGSISTERRRTSSAFFNNGSLQAPTLLSQLSQQNQQSQSQDQNQSQSQQNQNQQSLNQQNQQSQSQSQHQQPQTVAAILSQGPSSQTNGNLPPLSIPQQSLTRSGPSSAASNGGSSSAQGNNSSTPTSSSKPTTSSTTTTAANTSSSSTSKDVPDLSLLARVPPPANPADQNPPCNTLYVGNLPPDATEAELRTLFSPQKGFRRLSFRTKNQSSNSGANASSHNHGPMCFVEFEDVAHATIALAELYGRALPRPNGSNGKGGIRLSFSKNPLGVRGPGNPRRSSQQNSVSNYGYQSFH